MVADVLAEEDTRDGVDDEDDNSEDTNAERTDVGKDDHSFMTDGDKD